MYVKDVRLTPAGALAHTLPASSPDTERFGPYRVDGELGRGGMGVVYRAEDTRLGRTVALKVLPAGLEGDDEAVQRLLLEARAAATLDHPNVCTVYEVGEADRPYIAFACYDGETLAERLARGALEAEEAVRIALDVASGVAAAHGRGIVHRDLKPSNVFVCRDGTVKVLDFGIAKVPGTALTETGQTAGTVEYSAPEQMRGRVDARSDVWGVGVLLYEMLTGASPFAAPYPAAVLYAVLHHDPPPPSERAGTPAALDAVVARCLEKEPGARYPDAGALRDALEDALAPASEPVPVPSSMSAWGARLGRPRAIVAALVLLAVGAAGAAVWGTSRSASAMPSAVHLAILPPAPRPDAPDDRAFAVGLAEALAGDVAEMGAADQEISVSPVSDVLALEVGSAREARDKLGANMALTGSLQRDGDALSLVLQLSTTGERARTLASRTITADGTDVVRPLALEAVAAMLGLSEAPVAAASTADPEAERFYHAGVGYLDRNRDAEDLDRAVDLFEQSISEDSLYAEAFARLGEASLMQYRATRDTSWVGRARAAVQRARDLEGDNAEVQVTLSKLALATGQNARAMRYARRALALDSSSGGPYQALAAAQVAASDLEGAEATLKRAVLRQPSFWRGPYSLGTFYFDHARYPEAEAAYARVIELAPDNFHGHLGLGGARQLRGDTGGAVEAYERVLELRPDAYTAYLNLGTLLLTEGDAAGAVERYRQALALDSTDYYTWHNLASAYSETGDDAAWLGAMRAALRRVEVALEVNPSDPSLLADAATYRHATGDLEGARREAERAVALAPADPYVQFDAARVLAQLGDLDAALDALEAARENGFSFDGIEDDPAFQTLTRTPRYILLLK